MDFPKKGIYRHFKGMRYELIDFARHSETTEWMVVYRALYGEGGLWVRPLSMWSETVERDGRIFTRFLPEEEYLELYPEEIQAPKNPQPAPELPAMPDKYQVLQSVYGYTAFREGQEDVIDHILAGQDVLSVMPTGSGKSICYQLPALMLDGLAIVISPLISLMKDQVNALTQSGVAAAYLNSSLTERQFELALRRMEEGKYRIVYVAPERLLTPRFLVVARRIRISMIAVDEAHCISHWGQDFRPSYLDIPEFVCQLPKRPPVCALTATATERVRDDIIRLLALQNPHVRVTGFNRTNLYLSVIPSFSKDEQLMELLQSYRGFSGIVYCATRKGVESVCEKLLAKGYMATRYHAGLSDAERQHNQDDFIYDRANIMVATNAFGMGIDKSNVRFVIHYNMPKDLESYYQEAGRAGRDGERADCHLLFDRKDIVLQRFFIDRMGEEGELEPEELERVQDHARKRLSAMVDYCRSGQCLRKFILRYFGEAGSEKCNYCSSCLNPRVAYDVSDAARVAVACVRETGGNFGIRMIADILRGANTEKIRARGLDRRENYGSLRHLSMNNVLQIIDALLEEDALCVTDGEYPLLKCSRAAQDVLGGNLPIYAHQEEQTAPKKSDETKTAVPDDVSAELFDRLRKLRMRISNARSIPPYAVFSDATLAELCRKQPCNLEELRFVKGIGEYKMQAFGSKFVKEISAYLKEQTK